MAVRENRYKKAKEKLSKDTLICKENRQLFSEFFEFEENKLKRTNGLRQLDESTYITLYQYILKFRNINKWFNNKPWKKLTEKDISKVYNDLEDGIIKRNNGEPFKNLHDSYYGKVFKSKPFEMAGKLELAKGVIQYSGKVEREVRFITEESFKKIVNNAYKPNHRLLLWLAFDIGENINSLLKLKKSDFFPGKNPHNNEEEYKVNLKKEILKRTRKPRSEITNYNETVELLNQHLKNLDDNDLLFNFGYGTSKKIIDRAVERSGVKCIPNNEKVTWKDLRSSMACDLLSKGYTSDEVNARLGHKPSSDDIDRYIDFLALDRHIPKKKVHQFEMEKLNEEMEDLKRREKIQIQRNDDIAKQLKEFEQFATEFSAFQILKKQLENK